MAEVKASAPAIVLRALTARLDAVLRSPRSARSSSSSVNNLAVGVDESVLSPPLSPLPQRTRLRSDTVAELEAASLVAAANAVTAAATAAAFFILEAPSTTGHRTSTSTSSSLASSSLLQRAVIPPTTLGIDIARVGVERGGSGEIMTQFSKTDSSSSLLQLLTQQVPSSSPSSSASSSLLLPSSAIKVDKEMSNDASTQTHIATATAAVLLNINETFLDTATVPITLPPPLSSSILPLDTLNTTRMTTTAFFLPPLQESNNNHNNALQPPFSSSLLQTQLPLTTSYSSTNALITTAGITAPPSPPLPSSTPIHAITATPSPSPSQQQHQHPLSQQRRLLKTNQLRERIFELDTDLDEREQRLRLSRAFFAWTSVVNDNRPVPLSSTSSALARAALRWTRLSWGGSGLKEGGGGGGGGRIRMNHEESPSLEAGRAYGLSLPLHRPILLNAAHMAAIPSHLRWALWAWRGRVRATRAFTHQVSLNRARAALARLRIAAAEATARAATSELISAASARRLALSAVLQWRDKTSLVRAHAHAVTRAAALVPIIARANLCFSAAMRTVLRSWAAAVALRIRLRDVVTVISRRQRVRMMLRTIRAFRHAVRARAVRQNAALTLLIWRWRKCLRLATEKRGRLEIARSADVQRSDRKVSILLQRWRSFSEKRNVERIADAQRMRKSASRVLYQWRIFTSQRLSTACADAHWKSRTTARVLNVWRNVMRASVRAAVAKNHMQKKMILSIWRKKSNLLRNRAQTARALISNTHALLTASCVRGLQRWRQAVAAKRGARAMINSASVTLFAKTVSRGLLKWRRGTQLFILSRAACNATRIAALRHAVHAWRRVKEDTHDTRLRTSIAVSFTQNVLSSRAVTCINSWRIHAATRVAFAQASTRVITHRIARLVGIWRVASKTAVRNRHNVVAQNEWICAREVRLTRLALTTWSQSATLRAMKRTAVIAAVATLLRLSTRRTLMMWKASVVATREAMLRNTRVTSLRIARVLNMWRMARVTAKTEKIRIAAVLTHRAARAAIRLLHSWHAGAMNRASQRALFVRAATAYSHSRLRSAVRDWFTATALASRVRRGAELLGSRLAAADRQRRLHNAWVRLRAATENGRLPRARAAAAVLTLSRSRILRALTVWHTHASAKCARRQRIICADATFAKTQRRGGVRAVTLWRAVTEKRLAWRHASIASAIAADNLYSSTLSRRACTALHSWKSKVHKRNALREAFEKFKKIKVLHAVLHWQRIADNFRTIRSTAARAASYLAVRTWIRNVQSIKSARTRRSAIDASILSRHTASATRAIFVWRRMKTNANYSRLLSAARAEAQLRFAAKSLRAWCEYTVSARERSRVLDISSRHAVRNFTRRCLLRAVHSWSNFTRALILARELQERIRLEWLAATFNALRKYAARRIAVRSVAVLAPTLLNEARSQRLAARGLAMWRSNAGHRARAARARRLAILGKAFQALQWYVGRQRARTNAREGEAALTLYATTRLRVARVTFNHWREAAEADRKIRLSRARGNARLATRVLRTWEAFTLSVAKSRFELQQASTLFRGFLSGRAVTRWQEGVRAIRVRREMNVHALAHARRSELARAFGVLAMAALRSRALAARVAALRVLRLERALLSFLAQWQWCAVRARARAQRLIAYAWRRWRLRVLLGRARRVALASVLARLALARWAKTTLVSSFVAT